MTRDRRAAVGLFLLVLGAYLLSGPGRIDIVDGQIRFDVAQNLLKYGEPVIRDPAISRYGVPGRNGKLYAAYNAGPSVSSIPLIALASIGEDPIGELRRFLFSLTSAFFGAGLAVVVFRWLRMLGRSTKEALCVSFVGAFATYIWPLSVTTFDQIQHAFLLALSMYWAWRSGRENSSLLSLLSGVAFAALLNYRETYVLLWPGLVFVLARSWRIWEGAALRRVLVQMLPILIGVAILFGFNRLRFGVAYFMSLAPVGVQHPPIIGNPIVGLPSLLVSPGKSVLLYSPLLILGLMGLGRLRLVDTWLARSVALVSLTQLAFISCLSMYGSDWAWGPRYLGPVVALWLLPLALWRPATRLGRSLGVALLAFALGVQVLAISLDHHRFFLEHRLRPFFWYSEPWYYFRHSALLERPDEIVRSWREWREGKAAEFAPNPYPGLVTYMTIGNEDPENAPDWIRGFSVFSLPRPWPLWMLALPQGRRPVPLGSVSAACCALVAAGLLLVRSEFCAASAGLRKSQARN